MCDVYCYQFLNELGFYVLSASSETNLPFLFEEVLLDLQEAGEEIRSVFGLRLRFQACHQRDATRLIHPGRVSRFWVPPLTLLLGITCSVCRSCRGDQPCVFGGGHSLSAVFLPNWFTASLQVCRTVPWRDFNMPLNSEVQVVPPFADPSVYPGEVRQDEDCSVLNLSFSLNYWSRLFELTFTDTVDVVWLQGKHES